MRNEMYDKMVKEAIEEFITVNYPKGLEYLNGQYLLTETVEG